MEQLVKQILHYILLSRYRPRFSPFIDVIYVRESLSLVVHATSIAQRCVLKTFYFSAVKSSFDVTGVQHFPDIE